MFIIVYVSFHLILAEECFKGLVRAGIVHWREISTMYQKMAHSSWIQQIVGVI